MADLWFWFLSLFFFFPYYRASLTEGSFFSEWVLYIFQLSVNFISKSFQDNFGERRLFHRLFQQRGFFLSLPLPSGSDNVPTARAPGAKADLVPLLLQLLAEARESASPQLPAKEARGWPGARWLLGAPVITAGF